MIEQSHSQQSMLEYNIKILDLFRTVKKEFSEHLLEESKRYGFTGQQMRLIFALYQKPGINLQELSEHLESSKSNVSGLVDRLVRHGEVLREIPDEDRRSIKLFLSPDLMDKWNLLELRTRYMDGIIRDASVEDLNVVIEGLEKLHELIQKSMAKAGDATMGG